MTSAEWTPGADPTVGILEDGDGLADGQIADLEDAVLEEGGNLVSGSIDRLLTREPSVLVAAGEAALLAAARADVTVPVLPVDAGSEVRAVPGDRLPAATRAALAGEARIREVPVFRVNVDGEGIGRALFDVTLITDEPARISEYSLRTRDREVAQFRADGVVVATPAGSHGYAGAAGGPLLSPDVDGVAVVPIGPFVTQTSHWVLPNGEIELSVERDHDPISLCVDDGAVATVDCTSAITVTADRRLPTLLTTESRSYFEVP